MTDIEARWDRFEKFGLLMTRNEFRDARTASTDNPHSYTLRKNWKRDIEFVHAVEYIRENGYKEMYKYQPYTLLDVNEHAFWSMGAPVPITILINRKLRRSAAPYNKIAPAYDALFDDVFATTENHMVFGRIGPLEGKSILDIGCGTGLALDMAPEVLYEPDCYLGIDPSREMLKQLTSHHPEAKTICTPLRSFCPPAADGDGGFEPKRFDTILALFGTGSYLDNEELARIPMLLNPGGRAAVMFYKQGYKPETHVRTGLHVPSTPWSDDRFPGEVHEIGNHILVIYDKPESS